MKAVLQRVKSASVTVDGKLVSEIGKGILVLAGIGKDDTDKEVEKMASKVLKMRLWDDESDAKGGRWKFNVQDIAGEVLCVSQFTLLATTKKGNKPDFHASAGPDKARDLYTKFFTKVQELYVRDRVKDGIFQAMMDVALVNDGPVGVDYRCEDGAVTLQIDTDPPKMDLPGGSASGSSTETLDVNDLVAKIAKLKAEYNIPAELLE